MLPALPPPIATGLLAYGLSGRAFHAPFLAAHPGFRLAAVAERRQAQAAAHYPGLRSYPSTAALLADPALELVVVNTPNDTHADLTRQALLAGKHVLLEKPAAPDPATWAALRALAARQGRHLLPYQNRRYDADFQSVQQVLASGRLGPLVEAHFRFDRHRLALNPKPFKERAEPTAGLLYDLGPHLLDQALLLFGRPQSVHKTLGRHRPGTLVDDYFSLHLRYPGGPHVFLSSSLLVADPGPAYVLHGRDGSFRKPRADPQEAQLVAGLSPLAPTYGHEPPALAGRFVPAPPALPEPEHLPSPPGNYLALFEAVFQTIRHGAPFPITAEQVGWQLEILAQPAAG